MSCPKTGRNTGQPAPALINKKQYTLFVVQPPLLEKGRLKQKPKRRKTSYESTRNGGIMAERPTKTYKAGSITASIWNNHGAKGDYQTVTLERRYKDKDGNWKNSNALRVPDVPKAQLVLNKAYEKLTLEE
jgi:hypothetical protein